MNRGVHATDLENGHSQLRDVDALGSERLGTQAPGLEGKHGIGAFFWCNVDVNVSGAGERAQCFGPEHNAAPW